MTKFLILTKYDETLGLEPMSKWAPEDARAHAEYQMAINKELVDSGEWVEGYALTGPELAKIVVSDGGTAPVITDGPFPEAKELLAGYQMVDVESLDRALEIAARVSAAPGPGGAPIGQRIEVRQVMADLLGCEL